jgi:long-chain fatty acid transport protein
MTRTHRLPLLLAAFLVLPAVAWGAGFSLYEQGARAMGSAGAYTARVGDASAIYYNPAGLAKVESGELEVGTSLIYVTREFAGVEPWPGYGVHEKSPKAAFFPSHLYWAQRVSSAMVVGFGVYNPFGLTTEWEDPDAFSGRFLSTKASITPFYFNPTAAVSLTPGFRVGAGLMAVHSSLELRRHVAQPNPAYANAGEPEVLDLGTVQLNGKNDLDYGFTFGMQLDVMPTVTLAANYRSKVAITYEGDADFTFTGAGSALDPQLEALFPDDQSVSTDLDFPAVFVTALAVQVSPKFSLEGDLGWTQWSSFKTLPLRFEDESLSKNLTEKWDDAFFFRVGAELQTCPDMQLRFGYYYDQTPQPTEAVSPLLPDNNRHGISVGVGKSWGQFRADLFGLYLVMPDRETEGINRDGFEGTYANNVEIAGLTLGYRY